MPAAKMCEELEELIETYLDVYEEELKQVVPSVVGLCKYINIRKSTIYDWRANNKSERLNAVLEQIQEEQELKLVNSGLIGTFTPQITKLMLCNHGYSDKTEVDNKSTDGSMATSFDSEKYKKAQEGLEGLD